MSKMRKSLSVMLLLSFLASPTYGHETLVTRPNKLQRSVLGCGKNSFDQRLQRVNIQDENNVTEHSWLARRLVFSAALVGLVCGGKKLRDYCIDNKSTKFKLNRITKYVSDNYGKIMKSYVQLYDNLDAGWSEACNEYLIREMAKTKYLLKEKGKNCKDELLFPATLLRIFGLGSISRQLRGSSWQDEVNISISFDVDKNNDWALELSDNIEDKGSEHLLEGYGTSATCYIMKSHETPDFYCDILAEYKSAIRQNKFLKEIFEKLYYIVFCIKKDGTFYCRAPECMHLYDKNGYGLKFTWDCQF